MRQILAALSLGLLAACSSGGPKGPTGAEGRFAGIATLAQGQMIPVELWMRLDGTDPDVIADAYFDVAGIYFDGGEGAYDPDFRGVFEFTATDYATRDEVVVTGTFRSGSVTGTFRSPAISGTFDAAPEP